MNSSLEISNNPALPILACNSLTALFLINLNSSAYILRSFSQVHRAAPVLQQFTVCYMPVHTLDVDPETLFRVEQSGQPAVVYECKLQGALCGMSVEGTTSAISAHIRWHGITGPDNASQRCSWGGCSKMLKKGSLARHIISHLEVKARCSVCGVVKCRDYVLREHMRSSELCQLASAEIVHGPEGRLLVPTSWAVPHQV